jgi:hypothetical protein
MAKSQGVLSKVQWLSPIDEFQGMNWRKSTKQEDPRKPEMSRKQEEK